MACLCLSHSLPALLIGVASTLSVITRRQDYSDYESIDTSVSVTHTPAPAADFSPSTRPRNQIAADSSRSYLAVSHAVCYSHHPTRAGPAIRRPFATILRLVEPTLGSTIDDDDFAASALVCHNDSFRRPCVVAGGT